MEIFSGKGSSTAGLHVYVARVSLIRMRPIRRIRVAEISSLTQLKRTAAAHHSDERHHRHGRATLPEANLTV